MFLSSAGDKSQCLQRYRGWGSLSLTASLAARGVWCPAQAASFACRVLKTSSSELLFSSCSRPSSLSCETRETPSLAACIPVHHPRLPSPSPPCSPVG